MKKIIAVFLFITASYACTKEKNPPSQILDMEPVSGTSTVSDNASQKLSGTADTSSITKKKKVVKIKYPKPKKK